MPKHHLAIRQFISGLTLAVLLLGSFICSARAAQAQDGTPLPDGFGTLLPAGVTAKTIVQLIAPGNDASLATLVGMKAWPYQKDTYVAIACFASNKEFHDKAMQYNDGKPKCWGNGGLFDFKNGARVPWNVYLAVLRFGGTDTIPKIIAMYGKSLDVNLDKGHSDLDMSGSADYPDVYDRFDFANYKISNNAVAFGIRAHWDEGYAGGGGYFESIMLFSQNAGHLVNILSEPIYYQKNLAGDWNFEGENIVSVLPHATNGFYDLQLKTKGKNWKQDFVWNDKKNLYEPSYPSPNACLDLNGVNPFDAWYLKPGFIYSAGATYCTNPVTGAPTQIHGPIDDIPADEIDLVSAKVILAGTFAYVVNQGKDDHGSVSVFRIDATTGVLKPLPGTPFTTGVVPQSITISSTGTFAYVVNQGKDDHGSISVFRIDATTGVLKPLPGGPFTTGISPGTVTINPAGTFVYVANENPGGNGSISAYRIDATTGVLKPLPCSPFAAGTALISTAINPAGTFLYAGSADNEGFNTILVYHINTKTGALTQIHGSPFVVTNSSQLIIAR